MITSIHGILEACRADQVVLRVDGFSLRVFAPSSTLNRLNEPGREVLSLVGFLETREE